MWQALNHYAYMDAVFLAERLYAEGNEDDWDVEMFTCVYVYL